MRANVNILTAASESSVATGITGYENSVAAHVAGDWGAHNQVLFYATPFAEVISGHTIPSGYLLRVQLTGTNSDGSGDAAFTVPAILTGGISNDGGVPIIIRQPASTAAFAGGTAAFTVKAISAVPLTYQWRKNGVNISGATADRLVLPNVQTTAQATYSVVVTNSFGSVTSTNATLTVSALAATGDGCFTGDTLITLADGGQRRIMDMKVGDRVRSYQLAGLDPAVEAAWRTWATTSLSATPTVSVVKQVSKRTFSGYFRILDLKVTYEHPLLARRDGVWKFMEVQHIRVGDFLWKNGMSVPIPSITYVNGDTDTYNLDVEEQDVYLANGVLAHNNFFDSFFKSVWRFVTPETALIGALT